jgi:hypothetical protein
MTGPEHYREADLLLTNPDGACEYGCPHSGCEHAIYLVVRAQAHATLALAAATALNDVAVKGWAAWREVAAGETSTPGWPPSTAPGDEGNPQ